MTGATLAPPMGEFDGTAHRLPIRVYYEDTDAGGIVYYANYLKFFERGRTDYLRLMGIDQRAMLEAKGEDYLAFAVRRLTVDYLAPGHLDDTLIVHTVTTDFGAARIEIAQRITCGGQELAKATLTIAALDEEGRPRRLPDLLKHKLPALIAEADQREKN